MSLFGTIMDKIFHHPAAAAPAPHPTATTPTPATATPAAAAPTPAVVAAPVDVEAVLTAMAANGHGGNWQTSIVDLLKLLDLDSSLAARKELATELNVHAGADGTAEQNIALQRAVMAKLAENGGKVPDSLRN